MRLNEVVTSLRKKNFSHQQISLYKPLALTSKEDWKIYDKKYQG